MKPTVPIFLLLVGLSFCDELINIQYVWRHGDRSPLDCYPTDPNLPYWSQWPKGELSTIGMRQHYNQGLKMKQRYIYELKLLNSTYKREEILVRASHSPRCIQSAAANMAGLYSDSVGTGPSDVIGWPTGWTPIPIHSLEGLEAHMLDDSNCPRNEELMALRGKNEKFIEWSATKTPLLVTVSDNSGEHVTDIMDLVNIYDCIRCEKQFRNLSQPSWITDSVYQDLAGTNERAADFLYGQADFGEGDDVELLKVRGGRLLSEIIDKMELAQNTSGLPKFYVYSAHDATVSALMRTLGMKLSIIGHRNPDYAAMLGFELWNGSNGYYVKIMYSANENSSIRVVTQYMSGCSGVDSCPLSIFHARSRTYLVADALELCQKIL